MSNVNIQGVIAHIKPNTTVYTPVVEMIVNSIQALEVSDKKKSEIKIRVLRQKQLELDGSLSAIQGFEIEDNGIGFTDQNRNSFDTLYSTLKAQEGGKGFGRFVSLKYFQDLRIKSNFWNGSKFKCRTFKMGKEHDIIVDENNEDTVARDSGTIVHLDTLNKDISVEKKLNTIARILIEKLLPYFITKDYICPKIILSEKDGSDKILLNDYISNELSAVIQEVPIKENSFKIASHKGEESFSVRVFKFFFPKAQKSKISLVAHEREVSGSPLHNYIPEFSEDFYEKKMVGKSETTRNYIIKAYVFGKYLDENVSLERGGFEFGMNSCLNFGIGQKQIEIECAEIAQKVVGEDISVRQEKKLDRVKNFADENPWYRSLIPDIDLSSMPYKASEEEIESILMKEKLKQDTKIKGKVRKLVNEGSVKDLQDTVTEIADQISVSSKNELSRYIAFRRHILEIFGKSLEFDELGKYETEGAVHDIIFPRRSDADITSFDDHNLWIIDERLNFTNYVSSDIPLNGGSTDRPDLLVYNRMVFFRGDNEPSNPITLFEFKRPHRDDFINASSKDDPIEQIVRYVNEIIDGKYKTPKGREINIAKNTPYYGYVICSLKKKVKDWLYRQKGFKPMPDGQGYFRWEENINLYIEVLSWDKILKDAELRNKVFFHKLGI